MIISTENVDYNVKIIGDAKNGTPLFFLHGFLGSIENWNDLVSQFEVPIILIDLPGHGQSHFKEVDNYSFQDWNNDFKSILDQLKINDLNLYGYSMGGRLALSFACEYTQMVNRLILESSSPGMRDEAERKKRVEKDNLNCDNIMNDYQTFVKEWNDNQLFINQKERNLNGWEVQNRIRLSKNPEQLSLSLQFLGAGKMPSLWGKLKNLESSSMLITGSEDSKYCRIATECLQEIPDCKWVNISNCGHNIHLEQPIQFIESIKSFLQS